jgi:hypothetical protein
MVVATSISGATITQTEAVAAHTGLKPPSEGSGEKKAPPSNRVSGLMSFDTSV